MGVVTRGDREISLRFEQFPRLAHQKLEERVRDLIDRLESMSQAAAPHKTGLLRSEIAARLYGDSPDRVAGYVQVAAGGRPREYPKAGALEYGVSKPRRIAERLIGGGIMARLSGRRHKIAARLTRPVHMAAFRYLRGPFDAMRPEIEAELAEALVDAAGDEEPV